MTTCTEEGRRGRGSRSADELLPLVYERLRREARFQLARLRPEPTLQATALVHEAWLRVTAGRDPGWECRAHFFGAAARAMRNILVEDARRKSRLKRGAGWRRVPGSELAAPEPGLAAEDLVALDEALRRLERLNPLQVEVVVLRFFLGLGTAEIARYLGLSRKRVEREWRFARAWLQNQLDGSPAAGGRGP